MKVSIKNFQSISDATINFEPGKITTLAGESNQGKTSILRAIKALLTNPNGAKHYIQHGKKKASVTIENNGNTLTWEREQGSPSYTYKGETFVKASKQKASDFCNLGFVFDNDGNLLNLSGEWDVLFPFQYSPTQLFKLFEDMFSIASSTKVLDGMKADETSCNRDILIAENDKESVNKKLSAVKDFLSVHTLDKPAIIKQVLLKKSSDFNNIESSKAKLDTLKSLPEISTKPFNTVLLDSMIKDIAQIQKDCSRTCKLPNIKLPEQRTFDFPLDEYGKINWALIQLDNERNKITLAEQSIKELETTMKELQEKLASIDVCPLCGQEWRK